jgi:hypothetical protein
MADIIQAIKWMKEGHKVSSERYLEGDYFYYDKKEDKMFFTGPGWSGTEEVAFNEIECFEDTSWFIFERVGYVEDLLKVIQNEIEKCKRNCIQPRAIYLNSADYDKLSDNFKKNEYTKLNTLFDLNVYHNENISVATCKIVGENTNEHSLSDKIQFQAKGTCGRMAYGDDFIFKGDVREAVIKLKICLFDDPEACCGGVRQEDAFKKIDRIFGGKLL